MRESKRIFDGVKLSKSRPLSSSGSHARGTGNCSMHNRLNPFHDYRTEPTPSDADGLTDAVDIAFVEPPLEVHQWQRKPGMNHRSTTNYRGQRLEMTSRTATQSRDPAPRGFGPTMLPQKFRARPSASVNGRTTSSPTGSGNPPGSAPRQYRGTNSPPPEVELTSHLLCPQNQRAKNQSTLRPVCQGRWW